MTAATTAVKKAAKTSTKTPTPVPRALTPTVQLIEAASEV